MLVEDFGQVGHVLLGDVGGQVDEGAVLAVVGQIVVGKAHGVEGVGQVVAGDADVDLLREGVAHRLPGDGDTGVLSHLLEHGVVVVAAGQGRDAADDAELGLVGVGVDGAGLDLVRVAASAAREAGGDADQRNGCADTFGKCFHRCFLLFW